MFNYVRGDEIESLINGKKIVLSCCDAGILLTKLGRTLHISIKTVYNHLNSLYSIFHVGTTMMTARTVEMGLIIPKDIHLYNRKRMLTAH
jgi:DNA-binding CsgD family transcriptional regulator